MVLALAPNSHALAAYSCSLASIPTFSWNIATFNKSTRGLHSRSRSYCTNTGTINVSIALGNLCSARTRGARKCGTKVHSLTNTVSVLGVLAQPVIQAYNLTVGCPLSTWVPLQLRLVQLGALLNMLGGCSSVLIPISVQSMSVAKFSWSCCVTGCPILVDICNKWWIVVTWPLAVTHATRCMGCGLARTFICTL